MRKILCEKCCVGTVIYSGKCGKTVVQGYGGCGNNIIYMDLNSGAKMADGRSREHCIQDKTDCKCGAVIV
jgi:hypothetical protein